MGVPASASCNLPKGDDPTRQTSGTRPNEPCRVAEEPRRASAAGLAELRTRRWGQQLRVEPGLNDEDLLMAIFSPMADWPRWSLAAPNELAFIASL